MFAVRHSVGRRVHRQRHGVLGGAECGAHLGVHEDGAGRERRRGLVRAQGVQARRGEELQTVPQTTLVELLFVVFILIRRPILY